MAAPNAMSHGLGGAAGAAAGALVGMSAANAGAAADETASAATTDNTTFFIESAPFNSIGRRVLADPLLRALHVDPEKSPVSDPVPTRLACITVNLDPRQHVAASEKRRQLPPF